MSKHPDPNFKADLEDRDYGPGCPHTTRDTHSSERKKELPPESSYIRMPGSILSKFEHLGITLTSQRIETPRIQPPRTYLHNADFTLKATIVTVAATAAGAGLILAAHHLYTCLIR